MQTQSLLSLPANPNPNPNRNPNPNTLMQALHFLHRLTAIQSSSSPRSPRRRFRLIRRAAYVSMALSVSPRMTWSRAILRRLRNSRTIIRHRRNLSKHTSRTDKLRGLVPGGKAMDLCTLLAETGDYIRCLSLQVKIMRSVADSFQKGKDVSF